MDYAVCVFFVLVMLLMVCPIGKKVSSSPKYRYEPDYDCYTEFWKDGELVGMCYGQARRYIDSEFCISIVFDTKTKQEIKRTGENGCFVE